MQNQIIPHFLCSLLNFDLNSEAVNVIHAILHVVEVVDHPAPDVLLVVFQMLGKVQSSSSKTIISGIKHFIHFR